MATIYKRGGVVNYRIDWFDHTGKRRSKSSGTTDKAAAQRIANKLETEVALRVDRVIDPRLDDLAIQLAKPITTHLKDYSAAMLAKGSTEEHITRTQRKIESIAKEAGFVILRDIHADGVNRYSAKLRSDGKASRTIGSGIQAVKGFTKWLVAQGKLSADPLATVVKPSVDDDRRLIRRFLSHEEWNWLDSITRNSSDRYGMSGLERALLYATAIQTGLRSNELRSLTRGKLHLTKQPPFILAESCATKNKKLARQYIQPELAVELQSLIAKKLSGTSVFNMPVTYDVAEMLRVDLAEARLSWLAGFCDPQERIEQDSSDFLRAIDSEGDRIDFHALRHTTASWLIQAGTDIKSVQTIMRHSDIKLTVDRYGHLFPGSEAAAIERIRSVFTQSVELRKTGTAGLQHLRQQSGFPTVRNHAKSSESAVGSAVGLSAKNIQAKTTFTAEKPGRKGSRSGRTRTDNQGIMSPLL